MWESPINEIKSEMMMQYEDGVMRAVQRVGFDVDKEELIKALQYDRNQYNKGYADAIEEFILRLNAHEKENWIDHLEYGITWSDIEQIAESMKGEKE